MNIRHVTTETGTFYYFAEDFARSWPRWELNVLKVVLPQLPTERPCNVIDNNCSANVEVLPLRSRSCRQRRSFDAEGEPENSSGCVAR